MAPVARRLVVATMGYNGSRLPSPCGRESTARSIALVGFGLDSVIELAEAGALLWRLRVEQRGASSEEVEIRTPRSPSSSA